MLDGFNAALDVLERRLAEPDPIDVGELARVAATSDYHFRRMFSALAGMPLSTYVRRRRLSLAAAEVRAGSVPLLDIAVAHGYGSNEAFARAFRAVHGIGPAEARRTGASLRWQPRISFRLTVEGSSSMRHRVIEREAMRFVGERARVPLVYEGVNPAIEEFTRGLGSARLGEIAALSDAEPGGLLSISTDFAEPREEGSELDYWVAAATSAPMPEGTSELIAEAGLWLVLTHSGPFPEALQRLWRDAYAEWFPSNPYRTRPGPELLAVTYSEDHTTAEAALWLPVERDR